MKLLTNLIFEPKGMHDPALAYSIKDTVMSEDGTKVYFALQDVPAGISLDDEQYWIKQIDVSGLAGGPVASGVASINGKTGIVTLTAKDVGALPEDTAIPDVSAFITRTVADLENYYLKSQTYTREEIDLMISAIPKFAVEVVYTLPTENISTTTVYLVPGGVSDNLYTEYIYVDGAWEILGSQRVDLTGYATQTWTQEQLAGYQPKGNYQPAGDYALKNELPTKLSDLSDDSIHRVVTDTEKAAWNAKSDFSGNYADLNGKPTIPTVPTKVSAFENDAGYLTKVPDGYVTETELDEVSNQLSEKIAFDPTVYGLPVLYLTGDLSPIRESKDNKVTVDYVYGDLSGTCTLKGQGATSYKTAQALGEKGKYNYTINFDNPFEAASGWGLQKKYCLKANYIDHSHSRNVVSAKLWGMIVKSRTTENTSLSGLVNGGAVDGFPIVIMVNDEFHGLYTFNIPKDGWMFGMVEDTTKHQAILGANDHELATQFKGLLAGDESDFELEFVSDEDNAGWVTTSLNRMIQACIDSWGGDLDDVVGQYLDWDSVIDYYIWIVICKGTDMVDKNYLLSTFDGTKWLFTAYDMDSTYGLNWDGSGLSRAVSNISFTECADVHRAYELVKRFKTNALKTRYNALRANVLSETRIMQCFENFAWAIPSPVLLEDVKRYPVIPGSSVNGIDQIGRWIRQRLEQTDKWIAALPAQETPVNPNPDAQTFTITNVLANCTTSNSSSTITEGTAYAATISASSGYTLDGASVSITMGGTDITSTAYSNGVISISAVTGNVVITISAAEKVSGYTNLVPTSTDTDGSIYNGVGYKDDVRLSSTGGVSGTAQAGSVTTGFMPYTYKAPLIVRIKGATWLTTETGTHWYVHFYDSNKTFLSGISESGIDNFESAVSVTYDEASGITTFDFTKADTATSDIATIVRSGAYIRLNAKGKGADLIVTVNEEITL